MNQIALHTRLTTLVDDFGYNNVRKVLGTIQPTRKTATARKPWSKKTVVDVPARRKSDAVAVVKSLEITGDGKRNFLLHLAQDYEDKLFMPNVTHVRGFLEDGNPLGDQYRLSSIRSRQQVTAKVFRKLETMSEEELRELEFDGLYGPPKRLAIYAEAIESFGRSRREPR